MSRPSPRSCTCCPVQRSFCRLPDNFLSVFDDMKSTVTYEEGEAIFHESTPCTSIFIVCDGRVKLVTGSDHGKSLLLRHSRPGELLAIVEAVLGSSTYESSCIAVTRSVVASIPREHFMRFVSSDPELCLRMTTALCEQYRAAHREARFLAFGDTSTIRLSRLLLEWMDEFGEPAGDGIKVPLHVTQSDLAQAIGAARETVTRAIAALVHRGVLDHNSREIIIHDRDELVRLGSY